MTRDTPLKPDAAAIWRWLLAGYWLALCVATHLPPTVAGLPDQRTDKLVHASVYAGLAWLLAMAWDRSTGKLHGRHLRIAWLALVLFAAADELTQPWFGRTASIGDWLADAVGTAIGVLAFRAWQRRAEPK